MGWRPRGEETCDPPLSSPLWPEFRIFVGDLGSDPYDISDLISKSLSSSSCLQAWSEFHDQFGRSTVRMRALHWLPWRIMCDQLAMYVANVGLMDGRLRNVDCGEA